MEGKCGRRKMRNVDSVKEKEINRNEEREREQTSLPSAGAASTSRGYQGNRGDPPLGTLPDSP
jgi:hypothetical protein